MDDFADHVAALRPQLMRIARQRVRNLAWAEDAVSETLIAALEQPARWGGRAQMQGWLTGILKHKLVDQVRRHAREQPLADIDEEADDDGPEAPWGDPQACLREHEFVRHVDAALARLPAQQGRAFVLRECLDQDTDDVCREMGVTANHLGVMLYRARHRLRTLLAPNWAPAAQQA